MARRALAATAVAVATGLLVVACGSAARQGPVQARPSATIRLAGGAPSHIAVIVMENEEYSDVIGSGQTPFINALAKRYALATGMYAITHPSLPNYLALTGGSTFGIDSDCTSCSVGATGIVDQLEQARVSWKAYMEDLPHPCFKGSGSGDYAKKHDPFMYYTKVADVPSRCAKVVPMTQLTLDERAGDLPTFVWITPNLCHDMHDCDLITGDQFLSHLVPSLLRALGSRGLLIVTWDEGSSDDGCCRLAAGGHIVTIVAGPLARAGARLRTPADHYSTLQAIEDLLRLRRLRGAACACTATLRPLLVGPRPAPSRSTAK
jgi:phosphatidylinositol-3-phosphatase